MRQIEYPLTIEGLKIGDRPVLDKPLFLGEQGSWVSVRIAGDDPKTYLGIMLGDMATAVSARLGKDNNLTIDFAGHNPAMWVPDLKRVVFGMESWWGIIDTPEKLRTITDQDIENVWYVKALKELENKLPNPSKQGG